MPNIQIFESHLVIFYHRSNSNFVFHQRLFSIKGHFSMFIFHQRSSLIIGRISSMVIFHQRLSSIPLKSFLINCRISSMFVFHQRLSSIPSKAISHSRYSSIKGCFSSNIVLHKRLSTTFHQMVSSIEGCFHFRLSSIEGVYKVSNVFKKNSSISL